MRLLALIAVLGLACACHKPASRRTADGLPATSGNTTGDGAPVAH